MAEMIVAGIAAANSADITVVSGTPKTVWLTYAAASKIPFGANAEVQIKSAAGGYNRWKTISSENPVASLDTPGTFRVARLAGSVAVGVDAV